MQCTNARGGTPSDDLIGAFMRDGGLDGEEDLVIQCMMAFAAGRVTTQKLLGSGVPLLLPAWGAWREQARENPSVVRRLADELLRVVTPTRYVARYATEDVRFDGGAGEGAVIRRGERVVLFLEAANRDPHVFADPHALHADRQPNPHLAFGSGAHRCPGAAIALVGTDGMCFCVTANCQADTCATETKTDADVAVYRQALVDALSAR